VIAKMLHFLCFSALVTVQAQTFFHCSDAMAQYKGTQAERDKCEGFRHGQSYTYPDDFKYLNEHQWYTCPTSGLRIVTSTGIPNHDVKVMNPNDPCVTPWMIELPLNGSYSQTLHEPGAADLVGIQLNGVPLFGPQEEQGKNAVIGDGVPDAQYWFGHTDRQGNWHYHSPLAGNEETPGETDHIGYAMDGFPLYGNLKNSDVLDECNGRMVNGQYQYHIRTLDQVKGSGPMCNGTSPAILWNYIFGCFHGDLSKTKVLSSLTTPIPSDCVKDDYMTSKGDAHTWNTHQFGHRHF